MKIIEHTSTNKQIKPHHKLKIENAAMISPTNTIKDGVNANVITFQ